MALSDALIEITQKSVAPRNRVDLLLDKLEGTPDHEVLRTALQNQNISSAVLTRALLKEYGSEVVKDLSVAAWRRKQLQDIDGL